MGERQQPPKKTETPKQKAPEKPPPPEITLVKAKAEIGDKITTTQAPRPRK